MQLLRRNVQTLFKNTIHVNIMDVIFFVQVLRGRKARAQVLPLSLFVPFVPVALYFSRHEFVIAGREFL